MVKTTTYNLLVNQVFSKYGCLGKDGLEQITSTLLIVGLNRNNTRLHQ
jgi:hypothetical protein